MGRLNFVDDGETMDQIIMRNIVDDLVWLSDRSWVVMDFVAQGIYPATVAQVVLLSQLALGMDQTVWKTTSADVASAIKIGGGRSFEAPCGCI